MRALLTGLFEWTDARFPLSKLWNEHLAQYYAPKNFNFWYFFGSLALLVLVIQIVTGIWLAMFYKPDAELAFGSVEYIMRDVEWGWLIRYLHSTGASAFFIVIYLHMFRALLYGSYKAPRELIWLLGMLIYLCLMAEAFFGYLLPWGQMSYWGAQVIISLFGALPFGIGEALALWIRGDYVVSDATLSRFYSLHVVGIPLVLLALIGAHLIALHEVGSNNPDGVEIKKTQGRRAESRWTVSRSIPTTRSRISGASGSSSCSSRSSCSTHRSSAGGSWRARTSYPANPLQTPEHILPVWYFTPYYAILRAIPDKLTGVIAMFAAVLIFFVIPWLDRHPVKSARYRSKLFMLAAGRVRGDIPHPRLARHRAAHPRKVRAGPAARRAVLLVLPGAVGVLEGTHRRLTATDCSPRSSCWC